MDEYMVQVIIPVYNAEKSIDKCVKSLLGQTFSKWQAIFVDDCSTDRSVEILEEYAKTESRIKIFKNETNSGVAKTRNKALEIVDGKYTAFLDSDDWWEDKMLECLYNEAEKGFDIVQCRFIYDFEGGETYLPKGAFGKDVSLRGSFKRIYFKMLTGINLNHVCYKLIRSDVIKGMEFDTGMKTAEDLEFSARMFERAESYSFINKALYHYYRGGLSLTGGRLSGKEKVEANRKAAKTIGEAMKKDGIKNPGYYLLVHLRVYIIMISKILRTLREKVMIKRGGGKK